jgi:hypothetical protein
LSLRSGRQPSLAHTRRALTGLPGRLEPQSFVDHPDMVHREFLRAGYAGVVLTIRPGFEKGFPALVDTDAFGKLPGHHPYLIIAQEIRNYAKKNYNNIPPASSDDLSTEAIMEEVEREKLIGGCVLNLLRL